MNRKKEIKRKRLCLTWISHISGKTAVGVRLSEINKSKDSEPPADISDSAAPIPAVEPPNAPVAPPPPPPMLFRGKKNQSGPGVGVSKITNLPKPTITRMDPRDVSWMSIDLVSNPLA